METDLSGYGRDGVVKFRSYLRGMETLLNEILGIVYENSDPTYEAWKRTKSAEKLLAEAHSDPTYEAWKQRVWELYFKKQAKFRSYLRGMETYLGDGIFAKET